MGQSSERISGASDPGYSGTSGTATSQTIDDATLKRTARAYAKVGQIMRREKSILNGTGDAETKEQAAQKAESAKIAAVKAEGMEPRQYNEILEIVQRDDNLQQKFLSYVNSAENSPQHM
jgi:hypothetical protein